MNNRSYRFSRIDASYTRYSHGTEHDIITCTSTFACPACGKSKSLKMSQLIPKTFIVGIGELKPEFRKRLLKEKYKCDCGENVRITIATSDDALVAYVDKANDLMTFLEEEAKRE